MNTKNRTWTGTPQRPADIIDFSACQCVDKCTCPRKVEVSLRAADGRTIVAVLTPDEADQFAAQITLAAELAR